MWADEIAYLMEGSRLQAHVENLFPGEAGLGIAVGITFQGKHRTGAPGRNHSSDLRAERLGCITKLLTAALLRRAMGRSPLVLQAPLHALNLELSPHVETVGITAKDLLNHTHGLDDSHIPELPLLASGYIDSLTLCTLLLSARRLASPGRYYSYGHAGAWLGGAVLESIYKKPYSEVLESELLKPLGIALNVAPKSSIATTTPTLCPAVGRKLKLTVEDILRFLDYQMTCADFGFCDSSLTDLVADTVPLPGWHSTERGVYFGWKYYGHGWFGHTSQTPNAGMLVRMHPTRGVGVAVASGRHAPAKIARVLFRKCMPDLITMKMPRIRPERTVSAEEARRFVGEYRNFAKSISISVTESSQLQLHATRLGRVEGAPTRAMKSLLTPAEDRIFFLQTLLAEAGFYVQFLGAADSVAEVLWNGEEVFPRHTLLSDVRV